MLRSPRFSPHSKPPMKLCFCSVFRPGLTRPGLGHAHPFGRKYGPAAIPVLGNCLGGPLYSLEAELPEDETTVLLHVRQTFGCVRQMLRYMIQPSSPPWRWCTFVNEELTQDKIDYMRACSDFVWRLFTSQDCHERPLLYRHPGKVLLAPQGQR